MSFQIILEEKKSFIIILYLSPIQGNPYKDYFLIFYQTWIARHLFEYYVK